MPALPELFFVIATQNPVEFRERIRCLRRKWTGLPCSSGSVTWREQEVAILSEQTDDHPVARLTACVSMADVLELKAAVKRVHQRGIETHCGPDRRNPPRRGVNSARAHGLRSRS